MNKLPGTLERAGHPQRIPKWELNAYKYPKYFHTYTFSYITQNTSRQGAAHAHGAICRHIATVGTLVRHLSHLITVGVTVGVHKLSIEDDQVCVECAVNRAAPSLAVVLNPVHNWGTNLNTELALNYFCL
jgi:hypothetical protein